MNEIWPAAAIKMKIQNDMFCFCAVVKSFSNFPSSLRLIAVFRRIFLTRNSDQVMQYS